MVTPAELVPMAAVACEAGGFAGCDRADFSKADLGTIRSNPTRVTPPAADRPRSSSTVSNSDQPSATSRSRMAYCSAWLSRLCSTWWGEDCRT